MKKKYLKLMALAFAGIVSMGFASCGSSDDEGGSGTESGSDDPAGQEVMTPADQKEYLEKVALEFMDQIPSSDFQNIADLAQHIGETYVNYDWDPVGDWGKDIYNRLRESLGTTDKKTDRYDWGSGSSEYNYFYTNYKATLMASNFKGHFTASNGRWVFENANDLQFIFNDKNEQQCVLKLTTSGNVKAVHMFDLDDWVAYDYTSSGNNYVSNDYYDRTQYTIGVPENVVVSLTQGGSEVLSTTVKVDLSSINSEEFDLSRNSLTVSTTTKLNNGYSFDVSQVAYSANSNASASFVMSKNGTALVTMGAAADVRDLPNVNVSAFTSDDFDEDDYDFDNTSAKNAYVKLDIIGKVQMQGTISDVRRYAEYLDKADENDGNEATFKSYINQANGLTDINLFYNGTSVKQANMMLEPFADETSNGRTWWTAEPVIKFADGSSYSTFEAFFNEKDFKKTIDAFKSLTEKYADLVD